MEQDINSLFTFVTVAEKNRKYATSYASGISTALRLFEKELNDNEKASIDLFKQNLNQIYAQVVRKNQSIYSNSSLDIYKKRIAKVLNDYENYGKDPTKMNAWNPSRHNFIKKDKTIKSLKLTENAANSNQPVEELPDEKTLVPMTKFQLQLRPGVLAKIETPHDMSVSEAKKIRAYIDYLIQSIDPTVETAK